MDDTNPARDKWSLALIIEQFGPTISAAIVLALIVYFQSDIVTRFATQAWSSEGLYGAVFGWSAIQTGFAFGVYGLVAGRSDGFIGALQGTITMERFVGYIKRANIAGFTLTFSSIPLIILTPKITIPWSISSILISFWFCLFIWALCSFLRLAYNFGRMSSVKDRTFHGA